MRMKVYDTWSNLNRLHYYHMKKCQIVPSSHLLQFNCSDVPLVIRLVFGYLQYVPFGSIIHTPDFPFNLDMNGVFVAFSVCFVLYSCDEGCSTSFSVFSAPPASGSLQSHGLNSFLAMLRFMLRLKIAMNITSFHTRQ